MKTKAKQKQKSQLIALTPAQLQTRQAQLTVVDVRGWLEYVMGHIPAARRLSRNQILKQIPKDQAIAVTCLSGSRSQMAAQWLISQGYQKVYNLQGGLFAWSQAGYPVKRGLG
jgi:hydroxyacylglutathione hydrolase